jgi:hypothetical protein
MARYSDEFKATTVPCTLACGNEGESSEDPDSSGKDHSRNEKEGASASRP